MRERSQNSGWAFAAFPLAVIFVFTLLPTVAGAILSFFEWSGSGLPQFIGLENYYAAIGHDKQMWFALRNTLIFAIATVPVTVILSFILATILRAEWFVGRRTAQAMLFLPMVISIVVIGFI